MITERRRLGTTILAFLLVAGSTLMAGCTAEIPDNGSPDPDPNGMPQPPIASDRCVDALADLLQPEGGAWELSLSGPGAENTLQILQLSGQGMVLARARVDIAGQESDPDLFEELIDDFAFSLDETDLIATIGGLASTAQITRILVGGDPTSGTCVMRDDGSLVLEDMILDYTITVGADVRLQGVAVDGTLGAMRP